ncbi:MAG: ribonuclease HIII [Chitinivibrionia bacterium]|nr:ribonuclease HIII [Chitinivibrionia bacterium]
MKYSKITQIEKKLCEIENELIRNGIFLEKLKDIDYGVQILAKGTSVEGKVTIYYSEKKGLSVIENTKNDATKNFVACFNGQLFIPSAPKSKKFFAYIGSDEAGKGDFFGPLVTAGFFLEDENMQNDLKNMGVCDSKKLNDIKISEIAKKLHAKYKENIVIVRPSVEKYNDLYANFKNLNYLLGWQHATVFEEMRKKFPQAKTAIFDKFAEKRVVENFLKDNRDLKVEAAIHGEDSHIGIAAASVIARDCFVNRMKELSKGYGMNLPLGAGKIVTRAGKDFIKMHGKEKLNFVAKTHFKTMLELE